MKNQNILPNTLVPRKIRLEVYKEALEIMTKKTEGHSEEYDHLGSGLCLLLPVLLWGLKDFRSDFVNKNGITVWDWRDTSNMFPELTEEAIDSIEGDEKESNFKRKYLLNSFIEKARKKTFSTKN